jgi:hypothetical protein
MINTYRSGIKKILFTTSKIILALYVLVCGLLYFFQEKLIFFPQKLAKTFRFQFDQTFEEKNIKLTDGTILNVLLFKAENSKGLIFFYTGTQAQ